MVAKTRQPPKTRRAFKDPWLELVYLCEKIHYWLYTRKQRNRAERYLDRVIAVLQHIPQDNVAIIRHEGLALMHDLKGELAKSIAHRGREIELIERLHEVAKEHDADVAAYMLRGRGVTALRERREILQSLRNRKREAAEGMDKMH